MFLQHLDLAKELRLMASGKRTHTPAAILAELVLPYVKPAQPAPAHVSEVRWLERLYSLKDSRHD